MVNLGLRTSDMFFAEMELKLEIVDFESASFCLIDFSRWLLSTYLDRPVQ